MLGVEIIFLRKVREKRTKQVKNVRLYGVGQNFYKSFFEFEPNGKKMTDYIVEALK